MGSIVSRTQPNLCAVSDESEIALCARTVVVSNTFICRTSCAEGVCSRCRCSRDVCGLGWGYTRRTHTSRGMARRPSACVCPRPTRPSVARCLGRLSAPRPPGRSCGAGPPRRRCCAARGTWGTPAVGVASGERAGLALSVPSWWQAILSKVARAPNSSSARGQTRTQNT